MYTVNSQSNYTRILLYIYMCVRYNRGDESLTSCTITNPKIRFGFDDGFFVRPVRRDRRC